MLTIWRILSRGGSAVARMAPMRSLSSPVTSATIWSRSQGLLSTYL